MPSVRSLQTQQYYGHPQNQFWKIIAALFKVKEWRDYEHKKATILQHKIALWDVIGSCRREGSADAKIKVAQINDFDTFLKKYPRIRAISCDSGIAYRLLMRSYPNLNRPVLQLPSPSPAHTVAFAKKLAQWKKILRFLDD